MALSREAFRRGHPLPLPQSEKEFSHAFVARFTQIDYARAMAFVALSEDQQELLGVARLAADPDYTSAEYAVIVRSDLKGRGLGWTLMHHLIRYAESEGLRDLHGDVLAANEACSRCAVSSVSISPPIPEDLALRKCLKLPLTTALSDLNLLEGIRHAPALRPGIHAAAECLY